MPAVQLTFVVNCAILDGAALDHLPEWIAGNPFSQCDELIDDGDDVDGSGQPYTPEKLLGIVRKKAQWNLTLSGGAPGSRVIVDLQQRARGATISIKVENEKLSADYERFFDYALMWIKALPKVTSGYIYDSAVDVAALHRQHNIDRPPACFTTHLRWVHFLAPSYYSLFVSTEDLLGTPALKVVKTDHDIVVMRNYSNPFAGADPKTLQRLTTITAYLRSKDRFMKDS